MRDLGDLQWFLGIKVTYNPSVQRIWLSQQSYIDDIARRFRLTDQRTSSTPLATIQLTSSDETTDNSHTHLYQRKVGSLNYAAIVTRPDIAYATSQLSRYLTNPSNTHMEQANRCIQYLYGTRTQ